MNLEHITRSLTHLTMTRSMEKGGAGVTVVVIVIILIIAGALFFMNRGDSTEVMVEDEAMTEEVQGAAADVDAAAGADVMMEDGAADVDAAADATVEGEAAAE